MGLAVKKKYKVEVEGVVTRTYEVEAEHSFKASELARAEFFIEFGGKKEAVCVNEIWKDKWTIKD